LLVGRLINHRQWSRGRQVFGVKGNMESEAIAEGGQAAKQAGRQNCK
jgi:hypothetical protein